MIEYISPTFAITVGDFRIQKLKRVDVWAGRTTPVAIAEIELDAVGVPHGAIRAGDLVTVELGYREKRLWTVFAGTVVDLAWRRTITLVCRDRMEQLRKLQVAKTFVDVTGQEVVQHLLEQAGVSDYTLSSRRLRRLHTFTVRTNALNAVRLVNRSWGLDWDFYFEPEGRFWWGPWEESARYAEGEVVMLRYGQNIVDLTPSETGTGRVETILLPWIRPGHLIRIEAFQFWGTASVVRAERVHHHLGDKGRTVVEWTATS